MKDRQLSSASSKIQMSESETEWEMERPALKCQQSQMLNNVPDTGVASICMTTAALWLCV